MQEKALTFLLNVACEGLFKKDKNFKKNLKNKIINIRKNKTIFIDDIIVRIQN